MRNIIFENLSRIISKLSPNRPYCGNTLLFTHVLFFPVGGIEPISEIAS
jgi:hypothetical protein